MSRPKKYEAGEAMQYITRKHALRKLQLSLNDFRRLCIIKGIYPREPKHRRRAQKGASDIQILYHTKDIRFLLHEPIIWTLRKYKIFAKQTGRDRAVRDFKNLKRRLKHYPELKIDHIVKERYPTFIDAIKDLDDCLTLLFLFSTFPSLHLVPREQSTLCRRLTIEFLHYVIAAKALRKVFISIKGYYFQANIKGQIVSWIVPHYYPFEPHSKSEVDFKVMSIFVEFYTIMLGFVNYRLYNSLNLVYPPQLPSNVVEDIVTNKEDMHAFVADRIAALNMDLIKIDKSVVEDDEENDIDLDLLAKSGDPQRVKKMKEEIIKGKILKNLFKGLKIFINREVPIEPLVLIIRCFGGQVSWDKNTFPGAKFDEDDETITHQIVDRQSLVMEYISRDYIQPQWVFDCVNIGILLPTNKYFIGAELPPHLSPFVNSKRDTYIPSKEKTLRDPSLIEMHDDSDQEDETNEQFTAEQLEQIYKEENEELQKELEENEEDDDDDDDGEEGEEEENTNSDAVEGSGSDDDDEHDEEKKREKETKTMTLQSSQLHREDKNAIKPKHRNLFRKLTREQQAKGRESWLLERKRRQIEINKKLLKKQNDHQQQQQQEQQPQQQQQQQQQQQLQQQQIKQESTEVSVCDFQTVSKMCCDGTSD